MKLVIAFLAALALALPARAQPINPVPTNQPLYQAGPFIAGHCLAAQGTGPGVVDSGTICAYTGPGDIAAFTSWWGLRAYSAATRGWPAINLCNPGDVACADVATNPVSGALVVPPIGGVDCTVAACTVKTAYDRAGGHQDITNAAIANRPVLVFGCGSGAWVCMQKTATTQVLVAPAVLQTATFSMAAVAYSTFAGNTILVSQSATTGNRLAFTTPLNALLTGSAGNSVTAPAVASVWLAMAGAAGAGANASSINVNGVVTTGTVTGLTSSATPGLFTGGGASPNITQMTEAGIINTTTIAAPVAAALVHNSCVAWAITGC